jgi:hypothetical protein
LNLSWQNQISRRNGLRLLACGLVFLGICVFAWGLRYKLSLYDPPHAISHRMPAAKLLTGKEHPEVSSVGLYRVATPAGPAVLLLFTLATVFLRNAGLSRASSSWITCLATVHSAPSPLAVAPQFNRPPPPHSL